MTKDPNTPEKFVIRMPGGLRDRIRQYAEKSGRSMNSEVIYTLEAAYPRIDATEETILEMGRKLVQQIETRSPQVRAEIDREIADLYDVLKYEREYADKDYAAHHEHEEQVLSLSDRT